MKRKGINMYFCTLHITIGIKNVCRVHIKTNVSIKNRLKITLRSCHDIWSEEPNENPKNPSSGLPNMRVVCAHIFLTKDSQSYEQEFSCHI